MKNLIVIMLLLMVSAISCKKEYQPVESVAYKAGKTMAEDAIKKTLVNPSGATQRVTQTIIACGPEYATQGNIDAFIMGVSMAIYLQHGTITTTSVNCNLVRSNCCVSVGYTLPNDGLAHNP